MPIELPDARRLSDEALQVLGLRTLRGLELGHGVRSALGRLGNLGYPACRGRLPR